MKAIVLDYVHTIDIPEACPTCGNSIFLDPLPIADGEIEFIASGEDGNADGVYDGAYSFGASGELRGTPQQIGDAVAAYLKRLTREDIERMKLGTDRFFLRLTIEPMR